MHEEDLPFWELRNSVIHGLGMFAVRNISKGQRIIEYVGNRIPKDLSNERCLAQAERGQKTGEGMVYIFDLNEEFDLDGNIPDNPAKFINHSCDENCEAVNENDRIFIYSKRRILQNEELTFDYAYDIVDFVNHPCRCGKAGCPGYIVARRHRPALLKSLAEKGLPKPEDLFRGKSKASEKSSRDLFGRKFTRSA